MSGLTELDATALAEALAARRVGCAEAMAAFLDRIDALNPAINAIVSLRPRDVLMAEARAADTAPRRGWLHGVPFALKDLVETAGVTSTHGSPLYAGHVPDADDLIAARIRGAGAIVIGKTNVPEFGLGSHSYNPVFGVTRNPYDLAKSAGGSSGGAAAALAARLVPVADGSDMMGSLRNPAAFCNVYGFRPSFGRVPDPAGDTFLHGLASDGPMARTPRDLARLLDIIAGPDPRVPHALPPHPPFAGALAAPVTGRRVGWIGDWAGHYPLEPGILDLCEAALVSLVELGVAVEPVVSPFDPARLWSSWTVLRSFAIAGNLRLLWRDPAKRARLKPEAQWEIERGLALTAMQVQEASEVRSEWFATQAGLFARFDTLALPSAQVFPFDADWTWPRSVAGRVMDTYHRWMEIVIPASLAGLPAVAVPAGFNAAGLPTGLQLIGRHGDDSGVLQLAEAYHQATDWPARRPPALAPSSVPRTP
jgi:amidase